jgi:hypothetical protein
MSLPLSSFVSICFPNFSAERWLYHPQISILGTRIEDVEDWDWTTGLQHEKWR